MIVATNWRDPLRAILYAVDRHKKSGKWDTTITVDVSYAKFKTRKPLVDYKWHELFGANDVIPCHGTINVNGHMGRYDIVWIKPKNGKTIAKYRTRNLTIEDLP